MNAVSTTHRIVKNRRNGSRRPPRSLNAPRSGIKELRRWIHDLRKCVDESQTRMDALRHSSDIPGDRFDDLRRRFHHLRSGNDNSGRGFNRQVHAS